MRDELFRPSRFAILLGILLGIFFWPLLGGGETFCYRDFGMLGYPVAHYHHESFWRGEWPLWNPLSNCGVPFLAQWGTMCLYPGSLIYLLLPLPWSLNFFCILHLFAAGMGAYFLGKELLEENWRAAVAGTAYVFSGITLTSLVWPNYIVALAWMPWILWFWQRARRVHWRTGQLLGAGGALAMQLLAGTPEISMLTLLLMGGLSIRSLCLREAKVLPLLRGGAAVFLLALGLSAAQLLPFLDLLSRSHRTLNFATTDKWAMPLWGCGNFVLPMFHAFRTFQNTFFQLGQEFLGSTYLGLPTLVLAGTALILQDRKRTMSFAVLALLGAILALGSNGYLLPAFRAAFPFLGLARYPIKFLLLIPLPLAILAAMGPANLCKPTASLRVRKAFWISASGGLLVLFALLFWAKGHPMKYDWWTGTWRNGLWRAAFLAVLMVFLGFRFKPIVWQPALLLVIALDGFTHLPNLNPHIPRGVLSGPIWEPAQKLKAPDAGQQRVMISPWAEEQLLRSTVPDLSQDILGKRLALWSHLNLLENIAKVNGSSTLQLREQQIVQSLLYATTNAWYPELNRFLGVSLVTKPGKVVDWDPAQGARSIISGGQRPIFADDSATLEALTNGTVNLSELVYLPPSDQANIPVTTSSPVTIQIKETSPQHLKFVAETKTNALVVIAQSFHPNWQAKVNGQKIFLLKANFAFQALPIGAGRSEVELSYSDQRFGIGLGLSAITALVGTVIAVRSRKELRKTGSTESAR